MSRLIMYPYKMSSRSARDLANALDALRVFPNGRYSPRESDVMLNWGCTTIPTWYTDLPRGNWINHIYGVQNAVDKLHCMWLLNRQGVTVPEFTRLSVEAQEWQQEGHSVVERHVLRGHSGNGIVVKHPWQAIDPARFYTKYIGARREYRVHIFNKEVLQITQKQRRNGVEQDEYVRNWHTGWVYAAENITPLSDEAVAASLLSVETLGLTFGAVDVMTRKGQHYILEVNTSPGIEGRTIGLYSDAIQRYINTL